MDQYTNTASTDSSGAYDIRETYPLGKWLVLEAFNTRYRTTGITYQGENETKPTTRLGGLVDLDFLPVIGLGGSVDWGVQPYAGAANGGIAGTVSYDTTRNELDPADAASEGLPARHPAPEGAPLRQRPLHRDHRRRTRRTSAGRATRSSRSRSRTPAPGPLPVRWSTTPHPTEVRW